MKLTRKLAECDGISVLWDGRNLTVDASRQEHEPPKPLPHAELREYFARRGIPIRRGSFAKVRRAVLSGLLFALAKSPQPAAAMAQDTLQHFGIYDAVGGPPGSAYLDLAEVVRQGTTASGAWLNHQARQMPELVGSVAAFQKSLQCAFGRKAKEPRP